MPNRRKCWHITQIPVSPKFALNSGLTPPISVKPVLIYNGISKARIMLIVIYVHHCEDKTKHLSDQAAWNETFVLAYPFCQKIMKDAVKHIYSSKQLMCGHTQLHTDTSKFKYMWKIVRTKLQKHSASTAITFPYLLTGCCFAEKIMVPYPTVIVTLKSFFFHVWIHSVQRGPFFSTHFRYLLFD